METKLWLKKLLGHDTRGIAHIERYSNTPNMFKETVAEHSFYVSYYSLKFGQYLEKKGHTVDFGILLSKAIVHDFEENFTGDIIAPFKHQLAVEEKIQEIVKDSMDEEDYELWKNAKDDTTEGKIISFADKFGVIVKCIEEIQCGNNNYKEIFKKTLARMIETNKEGMFSELVDPIEQVAKELVNS